MIDCNVFLGIKIKKITRKKIIEITRFVLEKEKKNGVELGVHLISKNEIKKLNNKYRKINKITDVLSFATEDKKNKDLGDIFICPDQIKVQAKEAGILFEEELVRILAHGILHLLGYDHVTSSQEKIMFSKQEKFVKFYGF